MLRVSEIDHRATTLDPVRHRQVSVCIGGIGVEIPRYSISNDELVASYNSWVDLENAERFARGEELLAHSSSEFIVRVSGICNRHVYEREGILDPTRMAPHIPARADDEMSVIAEFGLAAARKAIGDADIDPATIDLIICSAAHQQRPYPALAIEMQNALGTAGGGFDMGLGCSSAVAALHLAHNLVRSGAHRRILVVTPELITGNLNFRDRQTHFIFGDAAVAVIVDALGEGETRPNRLELIDTRLWTQFSNSIRSNFGFLSRLAGDDPSVLEVEGQLISQVGGRVFRDVTIAGHQFIVDFLGEHGQEPASIRRYWLHQANARMNAMILKLALGQDVGQDIAPTVLDKLGNTAAAGAIIALQRHHADLQPGQHGLLCAFGAGYSIGGALVRMM